MNLVEKVNLAIKNREIIANLTAKTLENCQNFTELEIRDALLRAIADQSDFYLEGWYDPPPKGVAVLLADRKDSSRTKFPTLRTEPYWPKDNYKRTKESIGIIYLSPVHQSTGIIADFGFSFYQGSETKIQEHLKNCLETIEDISDYAKVGMKFKSLHKFAQELLTKRGFDNGWMLTYDDPLHGANFGHNIPWTHEEPNHIEKNAINSKDFTSLRQIITNEKRFYINSIEDYVIPETIAFSIEPRLGSISNLKLPGVYFYCLVTFCEGEKRVVTNFNGIFDSLNIVYMRSRF